MLIYDSNINYLHLQTGLRLRSKVLGNIVLHLTERSKYESQQTVGTRKEEVKVQLYHDHSY